MGRSSDLRFWGEKLLKDHHDYTDPDGDGLNFDVPKHLQDQFGDFSPPFWPRTKPSDMRQENSALLPNGRKEMMDMVKDMPESSYELSLKDIVNGQQTMDEVQVKEVVAKSKKMKHKMERKIPVSNNCQISRTESMESEVYLVKLFLPLSLSFSKKTKTRKDSKICSGQSQTSEGSRRRANKDWWKIIALAVKDNQMDTKIDKRASGNGSNITREENHYQDSNEGGAFVEKYDNRQVQRGPCLRGCKTKAGVPKQHALKTVLSYLINYNSSLQT
ncbi:hypothetical protein STAS_11543 [Striga asiatica]|uniref:Uncharacterized protein n=1 Tax=Striga asiatica TaxID=4170 RepID=A0A5A7PQZ4_STRAF|nr:hypothetical protein STAS_11543 [Striga asiatica]